MIIADIVMKTGDIRPRVDAVLKDVDGVVDLTDATVRFLMKDDSDALVIDQSTTGAQVTLLTATCGHVRYSWLSTDTTSAGHFLAEWEVKFLDGSVVTFPNNDWLTVLIADELG